MKNKLRTLISQGKIKQVIQQLLKLTRQLEDTDLYNEVLSLSARFEQYRKTKRQGVISFEQKEIFKAKINQALLEIIEQLPERKERGSSISKDDNLHSIDASPSGKLWRWIVGLGLLIAIPAGIAELSGYSIRDWFEGDADAFSVTVLVHGKAGKDDRILQGQGKVILDIGNTRETEPINAEGETTFKGLSESYVGRQALISIEHPQPYFPTNRDTTYLLERRKSIYLEVELTGINKIYGRVLDFETETPLDSVRVSVQNVATYSDEFGWYELQLPPEKQAKFVRVTFYKLGYQMHTLDSIAPHTQQEIGLSLQKQQQ